MSKSYVYDTTRRSDDQAGGATSRRTLAPGIFALALLGTGAATAAATSPDADLLAACAELDALERQYQAAFVGAVTPADQDRVNALGELIADAQAPLVTRICTHQVATLEGFRALATSLHLWDSEFGAEDSEHGCTNDRLAAALVRGLMGRLA